MGSISNSACDALKPRQSRPTSSPRAAAMACQNTILVLPACAAAVLTLAGATAASAAAPASRLRRRIVEVLPEARPQAPHCCTAAFLASPNAGAIAEHFLAAQY